LAWWPALGRVLVVRNVFLLTMNGSNCVLGDLQCCFFGTLPQICDLDKNPVSELYGQFLRSHVNCRSMCRHMCTFSNHVQSIEFTTGRMINRNRMHLSWILSLIAKGLNTYVNKVFLFFIFNTFTKISKHLFSLRHYGVLCED
jgi:hypothetical protein